ncbi:MAG TPA: VOC family protein [Candidatus Nanoarchaeia archaeon]|nr:VOC family protein [Candidatus Nanoarchaeia archaeon]
MKSEVGYVVPMMHVMDVERSVKFYEMLGFTAAEVLRHDDGKAFWAYLACHRGRPEKRTTENESAAVMVTQAGHPVDATVQGALLYMYSPDLVGLREKLVAGGVKVSEIVPRFYMPKGEMELTDPDGYCVLIGAV